MRIFSSTGITWYLQGHIYAVNKYCPCSLEIYAYLYKISTILFKSLKMDHPKRSIKRIRTPLVIQKSPLNFKKRDVKIICLFVKCKHCIFQLIFSKFKQLAFIYLSVLNEGWRFKITKGTFKMDFNNDQTSLIYGCRVFQPITSALDPQIFLKVNWTPRLLSFLYSTWRYIF